MSFKVAKTKSPEKQQKRKNVRQPKGSDGTAEKKKTEGMPKRPMSSYLFFTCEKRKDVKRDNPGISMIETNKLLGNKTSIKQSF